jgi:hypothetical protein
VVPSRRADAPAAVKTAKIKARIEELDAKRSLRSALHLH